MRIDSVNRIWKVAYFRDIPKGEIFKTNGNTWRKASTRTARAVSEGLPSHAFYFGQGEVCEVIHANP